ncbi:MAG: DUF302 domain-containing protein [bacterium]|nr:DUF302 domain-containing protein [bacterium]
MNYGSSISTTLGFDEAVERAKAALKEQGFGVLCEIDVAKTMREKIGAEMEPYLILGACNPHFAYQALQREPELGLLLPCNVVVARRGERTDIMAIDADAMLGVTGNAELKPIAAEVNARMRDALAAIAAVPA